MSEIGEIFKALKPIRQEESRKRKEANTCNSTAMLERNGFDFESKNSGLHLVVSGKDGGEGKIADFWPSTGKFCVRGTNEYRRGVRLLIKVMRGEHD
jgi:hypothetical protein